MSNNHIIAELRDVSYTHWNHQEPTLRNVSLQLERGTLSVLVGPGGCGKSTLCDLLNGRIPKLLGGQLTGEVIIDGLDTAKVEVKELTKRVGSVSQDPETMFATLYVEDEIAFGPENLLVDAEEIRLTVEELLDATQLRPQRRNLVWQLSGGQVQKLGLATALAMKPSLIILDEPTANLDPIATRSVYELILKLREQGMTILLVIRELDEFLSCADQVLLLQEGTLLTSGTPQEVLKTHGEAMFTSLGVWLPETTEIGLTLRNRHNVSMQDIPITVAETVALLQDNHLLDKKLVLPERSSEQPDSLPELLVEARNLSFRYGNGTHALKDVSFNVHAGEMLAIVGRNGAGKSTLAKLLVGLLKPQAGSLTLFGKPAAHWKVEDLANHIALVFQNPEHQFLTDKVWDEIDYSLLARNVTDLEVRKQTIQESLARLGLEAVSDKHPFSLSAGMKRRLGVATMLVCRPRILLVDEPTYGQDKQMTQTLMKFMEEIRAEGIAVVMITHDMRLVQEYAQRVIVMSEGEILFDGQPQGLFNQDEILQAANLRKTVLHDLVSELTARGVEISGEVRTTADLLAALTSQEEVLHG
jgi:energy-coupling factor transporter ATP-binding protein EcfA2